MLYILVGLLLWTAAHGFKRLFPGVRNAMGNGGRGLVAIGIFISIGLMAAGYNSSETAVLWTTPDWIIPVNNILMLISVYLFAVGGAKTRLALTIRHPMLNGLIVWGVAHILVNGDLSSLVLFGGLVLWAYLAKFLINRDVPWELPAGSSLGKEAGVLIVSIIVYIGLLHAHAYLGSNPFWHGWPIGA